MNKYNKNKNPSFGLKNPSINNNPFWMNMVVSSTSPFILRKKYGDNDKTPIWTFKWRIGMTKTVYNYNGLNVIVYIGGQHGDKNDIDFYVYNDIIKIIDDKINIYTYPKKIFSCWGCC